MPKSTICLQDDKNLLEAMLSDQATAGELFNASDYWKFNSGRVVDELRRNGITNFRRNTRIGKGYVDILQRNPFDTHDTNSKTYRLYRFVASLPLLQRYILSRFENAIRVSQDVATRLEGELLLLNGAVVFAKYANFLNDIETLVGEPEACINVNGRETSLTYLDQLCRIETLATSIKFDNGRRFIEIGGGFGVNAHLQLSLYSNIESYLYIDIPPMLYVGSQYLKAHFGDAVYSYTDWLRTRPTDLTSIKHRILCLPPWVMRYSKFAWDRAWNSASFQEMNKGQVDFYIDYLADNAANEEARMGLIYYHSNNNSMVDTQFTSTLSRRLSLSEITKKPIPYAHNFQTYYLGKPKSVNSNY